MALVCQLLSALCSATREHLTAVRGCHSLQKAMLLFSVELLRLICPFHLRTLLIKHITVIWTNMKSRENLSHNLSILNYNPNSMCMSTKIFLNEQIYENFTFCRESLFSAPLVRGAVTAGD